MLLFALLLALPSQNDLERAVQEAIAAACPGRKASLDRDLTRACHAYTDAASSGKAALSGIAVSFYASLESAEPAPVAGVATVGPSSRADRAVRELFSHACRFNRVGVAAALLPGDEAVVCTLTADHQTDLAPIPGRVEEFDVVQVAGRLAPGLANPRLFVTRPTGEVEEIGLTASGGDFVTKIALRETGEHSIEVLADSAGGPQVVALRRVFAGIKPPEAPPPEVKLGKGLDGVETAIARLRASRGLPPLERDPVLDEVSEAHSREMARVKVFAHVLGTDGTPGDRLRARGYAFRTAGENIGLAEDAGGAHEAIVGSPAHLANLLDPRHRRLGLGEARGMTPEGTEGLYLTEVLAAPIVTSKDPAADVAGVVEAERRKKGLRPLQRDRTLDLVARQQVDAAAQADALKLSGDSAGLALEKVPELSSAVAELYVGGGADIVAASKNLGEPRWTRVGVGAVYAGSRQNGPGRLWVVLLYGR
ncbi:MAG: CAP domain-containing protein [Myxococcales bacterium]